LQGTQAAGRVRESILDAMRQTIERDRLIGAGDRIVIGLSGGADSVTLSVLLPDVAREFGAEVVALAHLNHGLRPTADEDQRFCAEFAARVGLALETETADVRSLARERRTSIEDAGRIARYAFLRRVMAGGAGRAGGWSDGGSATRIAVAHTRNDQAETVLLRLCRGAGPKGLASIYPKAGPVIRPLLDVRRAAIDAFVAAEGIAFREDPTNRDVTIPRNRVRHELLPYLARHVGDGIVDVLARQAVIAREDADWLEQVATESARSLVLEEETGVSVDVGGLRKLHPALARRVIQAALTRAAQSPRKRRFIGFDHVDAVASLAGRCDPGTPGGKIEAETIDLPGLRVKHSRGRLWFEPRPPDPGRAGRRRGRPKRV
jgi:tRNA(Ile)-lysidine synthase